MTNWIARRVSMLVHPVMAMFHQIEVMPVLSLAQQHIEIARDRVRRVTMRAQCAPFPDQVPVGIDLQHVPVGLNRGGIPKRATNNHIYGLIRVGGWIGAEAMFS